MEVRNDKTKEEVTAGGSVVADEGQLLFVKILQVPLLEADLAGIVCKEKTDLNVNNDSFWTPGAVGAPPHYLLGRGLVEYYALPSSRCCDFSSNRHYGDRSFVKSPFDGGC